MSTVARLTSCEANSLVPHEDARRLAGRLVAFLFLMISVQPASADDQAEALVAVIREARRLIVQGSIPPALELLDRAVGLAGAIAAAAPTPEPGLIESLYWERAVGNAEFAATLSNQSQAEQYLERARDRWKEYLDWYSALTPQQQRALPAANRRPLKAAVHLGNAVLRMQKYEEVLTDYKSLNTDFLSIQAFSNWKTALYTCPSWARPRSGERNADDRKRAVCSDTCTSEWEIYADTLSNWAPTAYLREPVRAGYLQEARGIKALAAACFQR